MHTHETGAFSPLVKAMLINSCCSPRYACVGAATVIQLQPRTRLAVITSTMPFTHRWPPPDTGLLASHSSNSLLPIHSSQFTPSNSLLATHSSQFTPPNSLLPIHSSQFTPPNSLLPTHSSQFTPSNSLLPTHSSQLTPPNSLLATHSSQLDPPNSLLPTRSQLTPPNSLLTHSSQPTPSSVPAQSQLTCEQDSMSAERLMEFR